jgi:streptogramin lyase
VKATRYLSLSFVTSLAGLAGVLVLSGCSANFGGGSSTAATTTAHIQGKVHGGQQALNGAHVYMYAASTTGYGGSGIAASTTNASTSLLTNTAGVTTVDGNGNYYVTTDQAGDFTIDVSFACTPGTQVYLYSTGGDPQLNGFGTTTGNNPAAGLLAVVGDCASATPASAFPGVTFVTMNEVSTIAAAYALAGFATDPLHIGAPTSVTGHSLSATGLSNAFKNALGLVNQSTGVPYTTLPLNVNGAVPVTTINTLADILAVCVNTTGSSSTGCTTLFADTKNSAGTAATDTAGVAINIAQHPQQNYVALFNTVPAAPPFTPTLTAANDFSLCIDYTSDGLTYNYQLAVDGLGDVWIPNAGNNSLTELSPAGQLLVTSEFSNSMDAPGGIGIDNSNNIWLVNHGNATITKVTNAGVLVGDFNGAGLNGGDGAAADASGNIWIANYSSNTLVKFSSTGTAIGGYGAAGVNGPQRIAIDGAGNVWTPNSAGATVSKLSNAGAGLGNFSGGGLATPGAIAIDSTGNAWVTNGGGTNAIVELSNTGTVIGSFTGTGLSGPNAISIDGAGNLWVANISGNSVTALSSAGAILGTYHGIGLFAPTGVAVDGSGNVWVGNSSTTASSFLTEIIGLAAPVITPISAGLPVTPTANGSSNLGTRP